MSYPEYPPFSGIAPYYDTLMQGVPYRSWVRYLDRLLSSRHAAPRRVLDLACGTGTVAQMLAEKGYEAVGVDLSEAMIAQARRKAARRGLAIPYYVQDAAQLDLPEAPFDLCVSLFDSLNYIVEPDRLAKAVQRVYAHLSPGGLFIFDINAEFALKNGFFDQDNMLSQAPLRYVWKSEYEPETRLCRVYMRFFLRDRNGVDQEFRETHVQFAYREEELREMLLCAGFEQIETLHAYTFQPVRPTTDRIFFIAQRPG
jgi:ubiquinone/menaquinone biosynthesis C-methylase UbiE